MILGIVAGGGSFPILAAQKAKAKGATVVSVGINGETSPNVKKMSDRYDEIKFGQLSKLLKFFKSESVQGVLLAGTIDHTHALSAKDKLKLIADPKVLKILVGMKERSTSKLLTSFIGEIEKEGMRVLPSYSYLEEELVPKGLISKREPSEQQKQDIEVGYKAAKELSRLDIGLCVCVRNGAVVALEAMEGTDQCINRAGDILKRRNKDADFSVVKVARPKQDPRYDLPVIGPSTIETLKDAGATCLAAESGWTLILERSQTIHYANQHNIAFVGI